jgi:hypothetical protein
VCRAISSFISVGFMDEEVNLTYIVLIPKMNNPVSINDFQLISLCNVLYKITSKVLAIRIKVILLVIISPNQSAFIPGRLIPDNNLAAYKTLHSMQMRHWGKTRYVAVKLDMSKTYDRVDWHFLVAVKRRMGLISNSVILSCSVFL